MVLVISLLGDKDRRNVDRRSRFRLSEYMSKADICLLPTSFVTLIADNERNLPHSIRHRRQNAFL